MIEHDEKNCLMSFSIRIPSTQNTVIKKMFGRRREIARLEDWTLAAPLEDVDINAVMLQALAPFHPIFDKRVGRRIFQGEYADRREMTSDAAESLLNQIDPAEGMDFATTLFERLTFIQYCCVKVINREIKQEELRCLDNPKDMLLSLDADLTELAHRAFDQPKWSIRQDHLARLTRCLIGMDFAGRTKSDFEYFVPKILNRIRQFSDEISSDLHQAFCDLYNSWADVRYVYAHEKKGVLDLLSELARRLDKDEEQHPIFIVFRDRQTLQSEKMSAILALCGPHLKSVWEFAKANGALDHKLYDFYEKRLPKDALRVLTSSERANLLMDCSRLWVLFHANNINERYGLSPSDTIIFEGLAGFDKKRFPRLGNYLFTGSETDLVEDIFSDISRKKLELNEELLFAFIFHFRKPFKGYFDFMLSLNLIKAIESHSIQFNTVKVRRELELTIDWLGNHLNGIYPARNESRKKILFRLETLLCKLQKSVDEERRSWSSENSLHILPIAGKKTISDQLHPPKVGQPYQDFILDIFNFYDDISDLRKCSSTHQAFLARLLERDADLEAEFAVRYQEVHAAQREFDQFVQRHGRQLTAEYLRLEIQLRKFASTSKARSYAYLLKGISDRICYVAGLEENLQQLWPSIHQHARFLTDKSLPSQDWFEQSNRLLGNLPMNKRMDFFNGVLATFRPVFSQEDKDERPLFNFSCDGVARLMIYCSDSLPIDPVGPALVDYAFNNCFVSVYGHGLRAKQTGNICIKTLANRPDQEGHPYLMELHAQLKYPSAKKLIEKAIST